MAVRNAFLIGIICGASLLFFSGGSARAASCKEPETGTKDVPIFSPPLGNVVTGAGRLQFYSAPDFHCAMNGVFVIPRDELILCRNERRVDVGDVREPQNRKGCVGLGAVGTIEGDGHDGAEAVSRQPA